MGFAPQSTDLTMALRPILSIPDPVLRKVSAPVPVFDKALRILADDMLETMYAAPGIGLAAIQIGVPLRLLVIDLAKEGEPKAPMIMANPEILSQSDERSIYEEGCLSIPEYYEEVERPAQVRLKYQDENGKAHEIEADGLLATCIQHELDHLDGKLFIDYLSKLKRDRVMKKFSKIARRHED
jgi:peptide deformylase